MMLLRRRLRMRGNLLATKLCLQWQGFANWDQRLMEDQDWKDFISAQEVEVSSDPAQFTENQESKESSEMVLWMKENILTGMASPTIKTLNTRYEVVWRFDRVLYSRMFGIDGARTILLTLKPLGNIYFAIFYMFDIILLIGYFKLIPDYLVLVSGILASMLVLNTACLTVDTTIFKGILMSFSSVIQMILCLLQGVCCLILFKYDFRGIAFMLRNIPGAFVIVGRDATNVNGRSKTTQIHIFNMLRLTITLVFFNLGLFPDVDIDHEWWPLNVNGNAVSFSTLGFLTQVIITMIFMFGNHLTYSWKMPDRLPTAKILLRGVDDPNCTSDERLDCLFKRTRGMKNRQNDVVMANA